MAVDFATGEKCEVDDGLSEPGRNMSCGSVCAATWLLTGWPVESGNGARTTEFCAPETEFVCFFKVPGVASLHLQ